MTVLSSLNPWTWFPDWLQRAWPGLYKVVFNEKWVEFLPVLFAIPIGGGIFGVAVLLWRGGIQHYVLYVNDVGHLLLLFAALFWFLPKIGASRPLTDDRADRSVRQFKHWLFLLLVLWFVFYLVRLAADLSIDSPTKMRLSQYAELYSPYVNILSAIPMVGMWNVLSERTVGKFAWGLGTRIWPFAAILIIAIGVQVAADTRTGEALPQESLKVDVPPPGTSEASTDVGDYQTTGEGSSIAGSDSISDKASSATLTRELNTVAGILNGLVVGTALALLIGRLDSRYIGLTRVVVIVLYSYALVQPLFPYIFDGGTAGAVKKVLQYSFVSIALFMKVTFILVVGMAIDVWRLHFYVSSINWLDSHAATMLAQYENARNRGVITSGGPSLFAFVDPEENVAILRFEKLDVHIQIALLNAWFGVTWDIRRLAAKRIRISESDLKIKEIKLPEVGPLRIEDNSKFRRQEVFVDLAATRLELEEALRSDPKIRAALAKNQGTTHVPVCLEGIEAEIGIVDAGEVDYRWQRIEVPDGTDRLSYSCVVNLDQLGK